MNHFHGSHETITEIRADGVFGGIFGASESSARSHGDIVHVIESPRPLSDYELNYEVEGAYEIALELARGDEALAEAIMSKGCETPSDCDPEDAAELGWEIQRLRGVLAARLGYTSVEMLDEHGTTWLCLSGCNVNVI